ncbi:hypothetical protein [Erythrobacter crassostreae]|uniref:Lipoprotein n=1 Tax=Erythrobacter crassostreae TaxID=2828328 RepID=A0A9X1JPY0_9SPHN|nr:hypothetical protein [Erythrobacter crassostrea]MBV7259912.1 hypothetical protein [Erythrobacter crassostrea]
MKIYSVLPLLAVLGACSGAFSSSEPGPITDEQFAELKDECGISDATLATGDRSVSFTTDDGIPVTGTIEGESAESKTVILGSGKSQQEMVGLIICLAEFQERTGAQFETDAGASGIEF